MKLTELNVSDGIIDVIKRLLLCEWWMSRSLWSTFVFKKFNLIAYNWNIAYIIKFILTTIIMIIIIIIIIIKPSHILLI